MAGRKLSTGYLQRSWLRRKACCQASRLPQPAARCYAKAMPRSISNSRCKPKLSTLNNWLNRFKLSWRARTASEFIPSARRLVLAPLSSTLKALKAMMASKLGNSARTASKQTVTHACIRLTAAAFAGCRPCCPTSLALPSTNCTNEPDSRRLRQRLVKPWSVKHCWSQNSTSQGSCDAAAKLFCSNTVVESFIDDGPEVQRYYYNGLAS